MSGLTRQTIELTSELGVEVVDYMGTDLSVVNAARVSFNQSSEELSERDAGLIGFLMRNRHASPFEHCAVSIMVTAPIFVAREWHRHRTQSYNEVSGRYTELQPTFYAPDYDRPLIQTGKPGAYRFELPADDAINIQIFQEFRYSCQAAWDAYRRLLDEGVAKEVARMVLPVNIYTGWYATANLRNWLNFLSLRADDQAMWEIRQLAYKVEDALTTLFPVTIETWVKNGRGPL